MELGILIKEVEKYVTFFFNSNEDVRLLYHNFFHTTDVAKRVIEIAEYYNLSEQDMFIATAAAWFHDTGYLLVGTKGHEEESIKIAKVFLETLKIPEMNIDAVSKCIRATKIPVTPTSLLGEILCDADTYHFGTVRFRETNLLVQKEVEGLTGKIHKNWIEESISLLTNHRFFTSYCNIKLNYGKLLNIAWLRSLRS